MIYQKVLVNTNKGAVIQTANDYIKYKILGWQKYINMEGLGKLSAIELLLIPILSYLNDTEV